MTEERTHGNPIGEQISDEVGFDADALREVFRGAFTSFIAQDIDCIRRGVSERNLCCRLAMVLEPLAHARGLTGYRADVEYNRGSGTNLKTIVNDVWELIPITCDLILHSRGRLLRDNLIAIEMKRLSHEQLEKDRDRVRLMALTDGKRTPARRAGPRRGEQVYGYELGYFVELRHNHFLIEEYVGGRQTTAWSIRLQVQHGPSPARTGRRPSPDLFGFAEVPLHENSQR